jgi:hypothetical protein
MSALRRILGIVTAVGIDEQAVLVREELDQMAALDRLGDGINQACLVQSRIGSGDSGFSVVK